MPRWQIDASVLFSRGRFVTSRARILPIVLLTVVPACSSGPPDFAIDREREPQTIHAPSRSLSIGNLATPPPGRYRLLRLHADGTVDARELTTFNGPGPWLAYIGRVQVSPDIAREALATIDATSPASAPGFDRLPCVLAFDSATGGVWRGCAYPAVAQRVLSQVPGLTAPEITAACARPVCQIRILREAPTERHEHPAVQQDIVLDDTGTFWCASEDRQLSGQAHTLRVEGGRILPPDARRVFRWLTAGIGRQMADRQLTRSPEIIMVRGRGSDWTQLRSSDANKVERRWDQLAPRLPSECRLTE